MVALVMFCARHPTREMLLGWAAFHQDELMENWELAQKKQELFEIEPLK